MKIYYLYIYFKSILKKIRYKKIKKIFMKYNNFNEIYIFNFITNKIIFIKNWIISKNKFWDFEKEISYINSILNIEIIILQSFIYI